MTEVLERPVETRRAQKIRLSLDVTPEMKEVLDDLAAREGITLAELMRRAVSLLKMVKDAERQEQHPALIDRQGNVVVRIVGP